MTKYFCEFLSITWSSFNVSFQEQASNIKLVKKSTYVFLDIKYLNLVATICNGYFVKITWPNNSITSLNGFSDWYMMMISAFWKYLLQNVKFSIKDFFSKCDQIRSFLWIWSYLLMKSLMKNFTFCVQCIFNKNHTEKIMNT